MIIYRSFDGLGHLSTTTSIYTKFSFGMMGFAGNTCGKSIIYFDPDLKFEDQETSLSFQCQQTTSIQEILSVGILKTAGQYMDFDVGTVN